MLAYKMYAACLILVLKNFSYKLSVINKNVSPKKNQIKVAAHKA